MTVEDYLVILGGGVGGALIGCLALLAGWVGREVIPTITKTRAGVLLFVFTIASVVWVVSSAPAEPEGAIITRKEMQPGYAFGGTVAGAVFVLIAVPAWQAVGKKKGYGKRRGRPYVDAILDVSDQDAEYD